jgi:hypothetical protein
MISIYGTIDVCSSFIKYYNKRYETITVKVLMLLIAVYPVYVMNQCRQWVCDKYCATNVSWGMLHMSSIFNTCYRLLMFVNCDRDHWESSLWHFWYMWHGSSTLPIMVQYLRGYIYSLSMIWRYYMNVMFIFLLYNQDLRECWCKSRSTRYEAQWTIKAIGLPHHHHIDCVVYAVHYRLLLMIET